MKNQTRKIQFKIDDLSRINLKNLLNAEIRSIFLTSKSVLGMYIPELSSSNSFLSADEIGIVYCKTPQKLKSILFSPQIFEYDDYGQASFQDYLAMTIDSWGEMRGYQFQFAISQD